MAESDNVQMDIDESVKEENSGGETSTSTEDDDSDSNSSTDEEDNGTTLVEPGTLEQPPSLSTLHSMKRKLPTSSGAGQPARPKMRIKLSLKLPTKANRAETPPTAMDVDENDDDDDSAVKASVARSDDEGVDGAVVVVAETNDKANDENAERSGHSKKRSSSGKRRSAHPSRPIKMPPISSPGLLMVKTPGTNHLNTPQNIFQQSMATAGYSHERRSDEPHRGSSVERVVGDLFDSDVKLALHFPPLVPENLMTKKVQTNDGAVVDLPRWLLQGLESTKISKEGGLDLFRDMIPVSLVMNYPTDYVEKHLDYVEQVNAREKAIVMWQDSEDNVAADSISSKIDIPPIPEPPGPPLLSECTEAPVMADSSDYPIYIPKSHKDNVSHLDPSTFHITTGRYFGLRSNSVADPSFCGPHAPGIHGVSGGGLGSGSTSSSAVTALTLSSSAFSKTPSPYAAKATLYFGAKTFSPSSLAAAALPVEPSDGWNVKADEVSLKSQDHSIGPKPTATLTDLQKTLNDQPELKVNLWKAAVRAVRSGRDSESFRLIKDGHTVYPNVRGAFSLYGGFSACASCEMLGRGAYDCRLKRGHLDSEKGSDQEVLRSLMASKMTELF